MLQLKMILRSWMRNPLSSVISVVSLTVGLVCSITLILFVIDEYRISVALPDTDQVYLLESQSLFSEDKTVRSGGTSQELGPRIADSYGEAAQVVIARPLEWIHQDAINESCSNPGLYGVTANFADIFDVPVKVGNLKKTLSSKSEIAVTDSYMRYVYGRNAVLGDRIVATSGSDVWIEGKQQNVIVHDLVITAILDETQKTPLHYGALVLESSDPFKANFPLYITFVKLNPEATAEGLLSKIKADTVHMHKKFDRELSLVPFQSIYFDQAAHTDDNFFVRRDPSLLMIGITVALAVLLIAVFNYINITMTRARNRLKNVAGQRIFGASRWSVRFQTVLDTALLVMISFGVSILIIGFILPQFNGFMGSTVSLSDLINPATLSALCGLLLVIILLPSLYILLKIEVNSPMEIFKNPEGRNVRISSVMVILQFVISVALIVVSINISRQMNFIAGQLPGSESILGIAPSDEDENLPKEFTDRITSLAMVDSYNVQSPTPGGMSSKQGKVLHLMYTDNALFDFYNLELIEGRMFSESERYGNVIVNEALLRAYQVEQPAVGQNFVFGDTMRIIGVVKDFMFDNAHRSIAPLAICYDSENPNTWKSVPQLYVKVNGDADQAVDEVRAIWRDVHSSGSAPALEVKSLADLYRDRHHKEGRMMTMVDVFMVISMLLTALGLFGLAFYTVARRSKEIALRKIHGSTLLGVVLLLCRTFAIWVGVAFVIAVPLAYWASERWLSEFAYRVDITWWVFAATGAVAVTVTFLTVIWQTLRAASANPVRSIKSE